jgi:D-lactate dehydrogenase (cytochrome)
VSRSRFTVRARRLQEAPAADPIRDLDVLTAYLEDSSGNPPGTATGLLRPASELEAASFLRATTGRGVPVLPQAARSSLTGGAVPHGEVIVSVERMTEVGPILASGCRARVRVGAGVRLKDLQRHLAERGWYYPPVPTYQEAMIGGTAATNAGGAATFKYGVTRDWVRGLRVLLQDGDLLEIERGEAVVRPGEPFLIGRSNGSVLEVPAPSWQLPPLKKVSAGYYAADPLDLVDLFVGSEGTLGLITEVTVDLAPAPPAVLAGLTFLPDVRAAIRLTRTLREAAAAARESADPRGPDVRAVELVDGGGLRLLLEHGDARRLRVVIPESSGAALLFEMELPEAVSDLQTEDHLAAFLEGRGRDGAVDRLFRILADHGALDTLELAFPEQTARREALHEFREAVPRRVNEILAERRRQSPGVRKVGGDLIVPFGELDAMFRIFEEGLERRRLDFVIWGHASDGNLHPNVLPRDADEVLRGQEALLEFGDEAKRRGGCPLSEHGVGRSPLKQQMLRRFLGDGPIEQMRAIKRALDPELRFAPGVLFPPG